MVKIALRAEDPNQETGKTENNQRRFKNASKETVSTPNVYALLHCSFETSKASQGCGSCCGGGHAVLSIFTLEHFNVKLQLILNLEHDLLSVPISEQVGECDFHR